MTWINDILDKGDIIMPLFPSGVPVATVHRHDGVPVLLALLHPAAVPRRPAHYCERDDPERDGRVGEGGGRARVASLHAPQRAPAGCGGYLLGEYLALGRQGAVRNS